MAKLPQLLSILSLTALLTAPLQAQEDSSLFFDTVDVYVVNVEVVVTDKDGKPVLGLGRDDFEVYEDGELVEVTNFFAVQSRQAVIGDDSDSVGSVAPTPETQRLNLVVFIDNFNMRPENRNQIFGKLREYLTRGLDSRDRVMLVSMNDTVQIAQSFTNDLDQILATLDGLEKQTGAHLRFDTQHRMLIRKMQTARLPPQNALDPGIFESAEQNASQLAAEVRILAETRFRNVRATIDAIGRFSDSLAGMRGRKAVLYVSDGLPLRGADSLARGWVNKFETWIATEGADLRRELQELVMMGGSSRYDASNEFEELVEHASANRVAFYPISNGGRTARSGVSAEFDSGGTVNGNGPMSQDVLALESQSQDSSLLLLAEGTGGVAFTNTTNIGGLLDRLNSDFASFYSLGYSPDHGPDDEFHDIEIKVKRPGLEVRHLKGYREKDAASHLQDLTLSALHFDLVDNQLEVRLDPGEQEPGKGGRFVVPVMVKIPFQKLLLVPQEEFHTARVSLVVIARDEKSGGVSPFQEIELPIQIPNGKILEALTQVAAYPLQLDMKKGRKRISVGVRDHLANIDSTVNLEVNVGESSVDTPSIAESR